MPWKNKQSPVRSEMLTSLTTSFDPHTTYMSPSTLENFEIMMRLQLDGIGASLQAIDGYTAKQVTELLQARIRNRVSLVQTVSSLRNLP